MKQASNQVKIIGLLNFIIYHLVLWLILFACIFINNAFGQALVYMGNYVGEINLSEKKSNAKKIVQVDSNKIFKLIDDRYDDKWKSQSTSFELIAITWNTIWRNGKFGEEKETYTINLIATDTLQLNWVRKCIVYGINKKLPATTWTIHGSGLLTKEHAPNEQIGLAKQDNY